MPPSRVEDFFKKYIHFLPQNYLPLEQGVMNFTISGLLTLQMLHTKFDVNGRQTTDHDGRQPIAIGHLSDSGDLNTYRIMWWNS